jgi:hypothetical protein
MEDQMRKSTIPVAVAIVAALSLPAQAAKFNCIFACVFYRLVRSEEV